MQNPNGLAPNAVLCQQVQNQAVQVILSHPAHAMSSSKHSMLAQLSHAHCMQDVTWSAPTTRAETVLNAQRLGLSVADDQLPRLHDIDTLEVGHMGKLQMVIISSMRPPIVLIHALQAQLWPLLSVNRWTHLTQ